MQALDRQLSSLDAGTTAAAFSMENVLAEVEDLLSYCNDILCTGNLLADFLTPPFESILWDNGLLNRAVLCNRGDFSEPAAAAAAVRVFCRAHLILAPGDSAIQ